MAGTFIRSTALAALLIGGAPAALAQTDPAAGQPNQANPTPAAADDAQTITVTARKRTEKLFDVPGPITAIGNAQVENLRLQDARDLLTIVPSAFLQENNAGTARDISIRGVGTPTLFAEPGVALYIDDIYSNGFISYPTEFFDLERVEVLRGPQGGLYGRNAVGGAVNVISARPTDRFEGSLKGTYARHDRYELEGVVNVPLSDDIGMRVSGRRVDQRDGEYFNQTTGQYLDRTKTWFVRAVVEARPTTDLTLRVVVEHNEGDTPGTYLFFPGQETKLTIQRDTQPTNQFDTTRLSATAEYRTHVGTFTVVAGGRDYTLNGVEDTDLSASFFPSADAPLGKQVTSRRNHIRSRDVEARWLSPDFGPVSILAGFSYLNEKATGTISTDLPGASAAFTGGTVPLTLNIANDQSLESFAGFVEANWKIVPTLTLTGDLRYTNDSKGVAFGFAPTPALAGFGIFPQAANLNKTFDRVTPGATLAWSPTADWRAYAKVQTGFRAGGFNFNVGNAANLVYGEETSINYEVGAKKRFMGGKAYVAVTGYLLNQDHVLIPLFDATQPPGLQGYLSNGGRARTFGAEVEGSYRIARDFTLSATVGYLDAELRSGAIGPTPLKGKVLPASRDVTASVTGSYRAPITERVAFLLNASYTHRSPGFQDVQNLERISGNDLVNASGGFDFGRFDIEAYVQNALNDDYDIAFGGFRGGVSGVIRAPGISYGISGRVKF